MGVLRDGSEMEVLRDGSEMAVFRDEDEGQHSAPNAKGCRKGKERKKERLTDRQEERRGSSTTYFVRRPYRKQLGDWQFVPKLFPR